MKDVTTAHDLVGDIVAAAPPLAAVLHRHLAEYGEILPHVLLGDVVRWLAANGPDIGVLSALEHHAETGDVEVQNILGASFLENLKPAADYRAIRAALGPRLRADLAAMEAWEPDQQARPGAKGNVRVVAELLHRHWDPIGAGVPPDEYDGYAPAVLGMFERGESDGQIAGHLAKIEERSMGLAPRPPAALEQIVAEIRRELASVRERGER